MKTSLFILGIVLALCAASAGTNAGTLANANGDGPRYNCGPLAVLEVGRHLQPENAALEALANMEALAPGLSMLELARVARPLGLDLVPVHIRAWEAVPTPAIALFHRRHYVAILTISGGVYRVWDPIGRRSLDADNSLCQKASGGLLLIPRSLVRDGMTIIDEGTSATYTGGIVIDGEPPDDAGDENCPDDTFENTPKCPTADCECPVGTEDETGDSDCSSCNSSQNGQGMAVWRVKEPTVNLWIVDTPLFYTTSHDDWMTFRLVYKQRNTHTNAYVYGVGPWWECNWRSYLIPDGAVQGKVQRRSGGGGEQNFTPDGQTRDFGTRAKMSTMAGGVGYELRSPRGAVMTLDSTNCQAGIWQYFPSRRVDSHGRTNRFKYEITTNGVIRLTALIDSDSKTNGVGYGNTNFPNLITTITNPYNRTIALTYDNLGRLTNITDMAGLTSGFAYDSQGLITSMATGYGVTTFTCTTNEPSMGYGYGAANVVNRSVRIVEPNGATHLYMQRRFADKLNATNATPPATRLIPPCGGA